MLVDVPFNKIVDQLVAGKKIGRVHTWKGEWRKIVHNIDIYESKHDTLVISSDFGSVMYF